MTGATTPAGSVPGCPAVVASPGGSWERGRLVGPSSDAPSSRCRAAGRTGRSWRWPPRSPGWGTPSSSGVHVVEIDWTLPLDADIAGRDESAQRVLDIAETTAEAARYRLETVLLQARDVGAAIVDEATERGADVIICGLPYRRRFGGDFAIGRTIPYILKNAPCGVWVIREAMPEEQA